MAASIDADLMEALQDELQPDEQVLWAVRPIRTDFVLRGGSWLGLIVIVGLMWGLLGFLVQEFGFVELFEEPVPPNSLVTALPIAYFALACFPIMCIGICFYYYLVAPHTIYAVTAHRLIIMRSQGGFWNELRESYYAADIKRLRVREHDGDVGDLVFTDKVVATTAPSLRIRTFKAPVGFYGIPKVWEVERLVRNTFNVPVY